MPNIKFYQQNYVPQKMDDIDFTFAPTLGPHNVSINLVKKVGEGTVEKKILCSRYSGKSNLCAVFVWDVFVTTDIPSDAFRNLL